MVHNAATAAETGITPAAITALTHPEMVALSPDGDQFAFALRRFDAPDKPPVTRIRWGKTHATGATALPGTLAGDTAPQFSPDDGTLAFLGKHGGKTTRIWLQQPSAPARPLDVGGDVLSFRWAPDSRALLAVVQPADAHDPSPGVQDDAAPGAALFVIPRDGKPARRVPVDGAVFDADWAPDGHSLVVRSGADPGLDAFWYRSRLTVIDLNGHVRDRLDVPATAVHASFSPDGRHIAYGAFGPDGIVGLVGRYDLADHSLHPLAQDWDGSVRALRWDADGHGLTALGIEDTTPQMLHIDAASGTVTPGAALGGEAYDFALDRHGDIAVIASTPTEAENVWLLDTAHRTRLTDLNPQVASWPLGPQRVVHWRSKADGTPLSGLLVLPAHATGATPLFVQIHGGPYDAWAQGWLASWHDWARLLAAHGIATLMPDPRGSDGRGTAFADAVRDGWGGIDARDILDGVDALVDQGIADPHRLAIGGWSYGGFMSAWLAGHSDRFRTAIDGAGPTDLAAMSLTTDVTTGFLPPYFGDPIHDRARYDAHSPLFSADSIRIPMLLLHGAQDARVPPGQSLALYRALRARGVRVARVTYPGAPHWFGGAVSAKVEIDVQRRVLDWLRDTLLR